MSGLDLMALADRCEAATAADRDLDAAIAYQHLGLYVRDEGHPLGRQCYDTHGIAVELPRYTASLDAAMTLVPEGWKLRQANFSAPCADDRKWHLNLHGGSVGQDAFVGRGVTSVLALCAAALRGRAQAQGDAA